MTFPFTRLRRLRNNPAIRDLLTEVKLSVKDIIYPYFVVDGEDRKEHVPAMPGIFRFSIDRVLKDLNEAVSNGIPAILLFGIPGRKDTTGSEAFRNDGVVQRAIPSIKKRYPGLIIITDVCLCGYTDHGHCGLIKEQRAQSIEHSEKEKENTIRIDNDETLEILAKIALSHAEAGADIIAPSAMTDGQVGTIRTALDSNGFSETMIMAYSAKFASSFYSPFRNVADSAPSFGNRAGYQLNPSNRSEAFREINEDIQEGADIVMVKPALPYLDIIREVKNAYNIPLAAYNVSGEYTMIKALGQKDPEAEKNLITETITSIKRAGADIIITYFAKEIAQWI